MLRRAVRNSRCTSLACLPSVACARNSASRSSARTISVLARKPELRSTIVRGAARRSMQQQQQQQQQRHRQLGRGVGLEGAAWSVPGGAASPFGAPAGVGKSFSSAASAGRAAELKARNRKVAIYMASVVTAVLGVSYAAVPLYKVFCQVTGFGGTTQVADADKARKMKPVEGGRVIRVTFDGGTADTMPWKFRPTQGDVKVVPGETALAFFTAKNPTKKHITGVATYNVFPLKAGIYFNKIQCFCFEEQRLRAGEEIDMPVFFFLDPEMLDDPTMDSVNNVTLSYTFFQTAEEEAVVEQDEDEEDEDERKGGTLMNAQ